jgi:TrmH family RNA methyltransferase
VITSTRHPLVQAFRRAADHPRRDPEHRILLDNPRLIAEALGAGVAVETVLADARIAETRHAPLVDRLRAAGARVHEAAPRVVKAASGVVTTQGMVALARRPDDAPAVAETLLAAPDLVLLVADGIQDPGNLGTMIRTAAAAAATAVAVTGESADPWIPKTLRATMGAAFKIPVLCFDAPPLRDRLLASGVAVWVADARAPQEYAAAPLDPPLAIVIGSEAAGPGPAWTGIGVGVRIPLYGPVESLNAAIAAALLLYETARRRPYRQGPAATPSPISRR